MKDDVKKNNNEINLRKDKKKKISIVQLIFKFMVFSVFLYLFLGEILLPREFPAERYNCDTYNDGWYHIKQDGSKEPIEIPGTCEAERKEKVYIENTLPNDIKDNTFFCIRSSKQEMKIYVDGEFRQEYTTKDTRLFGKTSAVVFVFFELLPEDEGKTITIETMTDTSYTGIFYPIYYGQKIAIWSELLKQYGIELVTGFFMLILGIFSIVGSIILRIYFKKNIRLEYLGWGILITSVWIICNSVFRQFLFPNVSVIGDMTFFMIMLMGLPFMVYMDSIQNERYHKLYRIVEIIVIIDFFVCTYLHVSSTIDFADTISYIAIICVAAISTMIITMIVDIFKKRVKEYHFVAIGILGLSISATIQLYIYFCRTIAFSGTIIAMGLIFLLVCSVINEIKNVQSMEEEKQNAITSNVSKGKFLANMSHEIRTPINVVLGMDAMILRESKEEKIKEYALDIQTAGQTLLSLINDILDFSKIESGKMEIIPVEYDFSSVIHDISNMTLAKIGQKDLKLNINVDNDLPFKLFGDEVRIRQVLVNLLTNAVKYTNEGSVTLTVSGVKQEKNIVLTFSVEDTGIGIKEEDIPKLFEEFERIEEKRNRNIEGTGLGMNITTSLLSMMGSKLNVKSVYGEGSKFWFELEQPIIDSEPIGNLEERIRMQTLEYNYDVTFVAPNAHVLVVDDNAINRKVFINLLKDTKIQIDEAEGGMECLELVKSKYYDLIFLDHMMPKMDGIETLHHMKEEKDYPCKDTPVIVLTANAISGAKEMYLAEGFDEFLSKPIVPDKLEKMIKNMLPEDKISYEKVLNENTSNDKASNDKSEIDLSNSSMSELKENDITELPFVDGVDWEYGKMHLPDMNLLLNTAIDFYKTIDIEANYIENAYNLIMSNNSDSEALEQYRIKVHAMKSSAGLIGAVPLNGMAKVLEYAARDGKVDVILKMTEVFLDEWRSYKEKLSVIVPKEETSDKIVPEDMTVISSFLDMLANAMEEMDIDVADETMRLLMQYKYDDEVQAYIEQLGVAVANLDGERVNELIKKIIDKI